MNRAIYAGTFDPITNGHMLVIEKSSKIFDHVFVCIAINPNKTRIYNEKDMREIIEKTVEANGLSNVSVVISTGLIGLFAKKLNAKYLIRGLRDVNDYLYEDNLAKINAEINPELETIYIRAKNSVISSSFVKELMKHGEDVSKYVPKEFLKYTENILDKSKIT